MVLFIYYVVLTLKPEDEILCVTIQLKPLWQYFHMMLFVFKHLTN